MPDADGPQDDDAQTPPLVEQSEAICRSYSSPEKRAQLAEELGAKSTSPEDLAEAYAAGFQSEFRDAVYRACLRGFQ